MDNGEPSQSGSMGFRNRGVWITGWIIVSAALSSSTLAATYSGGAGTAGSPYLISTPADLLTLSNPANSADWSMQFLMTNDIDMIGVTGFTPIAPDTDPATTTFEGTKFVGVFDGSGHAIDNLTINLPAQPYVGLFGYLSGSACEVKNLGLQNCNLSGKLYIGGIVGFCSAAKLTSTYTTGLISVSGTTISLQLRAYAGGLAGSITSNAIITNSYAATNITGNGSYAGGLVGEAPSNDTITGCFSTGDVVVSGENVGGLVGSGYVNITSCYATGTVSGSGSVGGLVGSFSGTDRIHACFATGLVLGNVNACGLVGSNSQTGGVFSSFWDIESSGKSGCSPGKGLSTAEMKTRSNFQNADWGAYGWVMSDGTYPRLAWEGTAYPAIPAPTPVPLAGSGTVADPYLIGTREELELLNTYSQLLSSRSLLTADLDWTGLPFRPIGELGPLTGVLDGADHALSNINFVDQAYSTKTGIFRQLALGGEIRSLRIVNATLTGRAPVGGLVGFSMDGVLSGCHVSGAIKGISEVGGLVGRADRSTITDCHAVCSVMATNGYVGGLTGLTNYVTFLDCSAKGSVEGTNVVGGLSGSSTAIPETMTGCYATGNVRLVGMGDYVGGLVGRCSGPLIRCFASGDVTSGGDYAGGLVGNGGGSVTNCYARGAVRGRSWVGGLAGRCGPVINSYATGTVLGNTNVAGLAAELSSGTATASFWDTTTGGPDNGIGTGLPTAQMQQRATFEAVGWDFTTGDGDAQDWFISDGVIYPLLYGFPVPIRNISELQSLNSLINLDTFLTADIDARQTLGWGSKSGAPGFVPIGTAASPFNGTLHGNGHRVYGLHIYLPTIDQVGLFGYIGPSGVVDGIGLEDVTITGQNEVGGLAGVNEGTVNQCYVQGSVSGVNSVGGLIGMNQGSLSESYAAAAVSGNSTGGLLDTNSGAVSSSFWDTAISGTGSSGGGTGLDTVAMQSSATYSGAGWDLLDTWALVEGLSYPYFQNSVSLRVITGPPTLINSDSVDITVESFVPGLFVTVGGGGYPVYAKMLSTGTATINVLLRQEAINELRIATVSATGFETVIADYTVYESASFPSTATAVGSLTISPVVASLAAGDIQQFECAATFVNGATASITPVAHWNLSGGTITERGLYTHRDGTTQVQAVLHTEDGWFISDPAMVTTTKSSPKSGFGQVGGVLLSHYTGLGLPNGQVTAYEVAAPRVKTQHLVFDVLGNFAFVMPEDIYHFEGSCAEHRSVLQRGGALLEEPLETRPGTFAPGYYSGQVKEDRPLQYNFTLRPNDVQAPWVTFIEPVADTTVNTGTIVVTAIDADKYSELAVANYTHNTQEYSIPNKISSTGFYRDTWALQLGVNVLHLFTVDTEGNASEQTIQITYNPSYTGPTGDADRDGLPNVWETAHGLNPNSTIGDDGADGDPDEDGLTNLQEYQLGTLPNSPNSDADTLPDGLEFQLGTDPLLADTDGDGINDDVEWNSGTDPLQDDRVQLAVVSPGNGMTLRGNAVTVLAEVAGAGSAAAVGSANIQVKGVSTGSVWRTLATDTEAPFTATWDTALFGDGAYELRAVATNLLGSVDGAPPTVSVTVSPSGTHHERIEGGIHRLTTPVSAAAANLTAVWDGTHFARIAIPSDALPANDTLTAAFPLASGFNPTLTDFQQDAELYLDLSFGSGLTNFINSKRATLQVAYPDADRDDHVDVSDLSVPFLSLGYLPSPSGSFASLAASSINRLSRCVIGETAHFSTFGVFEQWPAPPVNVYTSSLPPGTVGVAYNAPLDADGGLPPLNWTLTGGALPDGVAIAGSSLAGVPSAAGEYTFTLNVSDAQIPPDTASRDYTVNVYDAAQPSVSVLRRGTGLIGALPAEWDIVFSEPVSGFQLSDVVLTGTASYGATTSLSGSGAAYVFQVSALVYDGTLRPTLPAGAAQSVSSGALSRASLNEEAIWVDRGPPQAVITCAYPGAQDYGASGPIVIGALPAVFTLQFTESVSGLTAADIQFVESNPSLTASLSGTGSEYTLLVTGPSSPTTITPLLAANAVVDWAGNSNVQTPYAGRQVQYNPDPRPAVMLEQASGQADPANAFPVSFSISFSSPVTGFGTGDVQYIGTAPSPAYSVTGSGANYNLSVTGTGGDGRLTFIVPEDVADGGNAGSVSFDNSVLYDGSPPVVTLGAPSEASTQTGPVSYAIAYADASIVTLDAGDIALQGTPTAQVTVSGTGNQTRVITLSNINGSGPLGFSLAAGTAMDAAGNVAGAAGPSNMVLVNDGISPDVTIEQAVGQADPARTLPVLFDINFNKVVTGFTKTDVNIGGTATVGDWTVSGTGASYTLSVSPVTTDGTIVPTVPAGVCQDAGGNSNAASTSSDNSVSYDGTAPTVTLNQAPGQPDPARMLPVNFQIQFSESVFGFTKTDVTVGGTATILDWTVSGSGSTYTLNVSPVTADGTIVPSVTAGRCQDAAGNTNAASTSTDNSVTFDATAPSVSVEQAVAQPDPANSLPIHFDVQFSEPVTGFTDTDVLMGGSATVGDWTISGTGATYDLSVGLISADGTVIPSVLSSAAMDAAGNANLSSSSIDNRVTYDSTPPSFNSIAANPSPAGENAAVTLAFTASEALAATPAVTVNGNPAAFNSASGTDYNFTYTVLASDPNGPALIDISGTDEAGNLGSANEGTALEIDKTKPTVNFIATPRRGQPPLLVQFTDASTPVSGTPILTWLWNFGDGSFAGAGPNPSHTYTAAGVYPVTLTINDAALNSDVESKLAYIVVGGPTADFTAAPTSEYAPLFVQFTDVSDPGASPITDWLWDFGDGNMSALPSPAHLYTDAGNYTVSLTVTNSIASDTETKFQHIVVNPGVPPVANFTADSTFGPAPLTVQFTDMSDPGTSAIEDWEWDFGDGETSGEQHPEHVYELQGEYTVTLTITTAAGSDMYTRAGYVNVAVEMPGSGVLLLAALALVMAMAGAVHSSAGGKTCRARGQR